MKMIVSGRRDEAGTRIGDPCQACGHSRRPGQSIWETGVPERPYLLLCYRCAAIILALMAGMPVPDGWVVPA